MNPSEAAILLAKISANDNREVTEAGARAWAEALPDVDVKDALECLPAFYREATHDGKNWIYPGDVLAGVRTVLLSRRRDCGRAAGEAALAAIADPEAEDVQIAGGPEGIAMKARIAAVKAWDKENRPLPGDDIEDRRNTSESARVMGLLSQSNRVAPALERSW